MPPYDAVVLAGGRARRAAGSKLGLRREGRSLLARAIDAVATADQVLLVGPETPLPEVARPLLWCREDPPFAGPVAAVAAALPLVTADVVVLLAGDLPAAGDAVPALLVALERDGTADVAVLLDADGVRQPLLAAYRTPALRARVATGRVAARSLLDDVTVVEVSDTWGAARDVDTLDDAVELGFTDQP